MRVLFVCKSNAERSQAAAVLFNSMTKKGRASSAGLRVAAEKAVGHPAGRVITELLLSNGYTEIQKVKRRQLTEKMLEEYDRVIIILGKSEIDKFVPGYLRRSGKVVFWRVWENMPHKIYVMFPPTNYAPYLRLIIKIRNNVEELVKEIG